MIKNYRFIPFLKTNRDPKVARSSWSLRAGFTLVEFLVVTLIISMGFVFLIKLRSRVFLDETVDRVLADIRNLQFMALSSMKFDVDSDGILDFVCGYGIHRVDDTHYTIYVDPDVGLDANDCNNRDYGSQDIDIETKPLYQSGLEFRRNFDDILFEPPDLKAIINDLDPRLPNPRTEEITISFENKNCNQAQCKTICIYDYGKVQIVNGDRNNCPN